MALRTDIGLTPTLYAVQPGHHLALVLTTQAPTSDCASLPSALTTPLPCILRSPQKKTLPGAVCQVVWSASKLSSANVPLLHQGALKVTPSAVMPTSSGQTGSTGTVRDLHRGSRTEGEIERDSL